MKLRSYQEEAIQSIFDYYQGGGNGHVLLALPTGTGKSLILAEFIRRVLHFWPSQRVIALTHVRELIEQNAKILSQMWPGAPLGIYSAGLNRRDHIQPIIYGGVASVVKRVEMFGHRDLLLIDEAHLLSDDTNTMYHKIIAKLRELNPNLKVIGLTATAFRLGQGWLTNSGLFTDIIFNICNVEGFHRLIVEEFISPPMPKRTRTELDVSNVAIQKGEYVQSQLQKAVDNPDITYSALKEACEHGHDRHSWLAFCSGIEHADHCADMLESFGVPTAAVHSKITPEQRDERIRAFKAGELRCLTNNNVLTTGFDYPPIDMIIMLRPTVSPGLWVQMLGRGTRPSPETQKANCLVLDYARNTLRLGPIDDPVIPSPKGEGSGDVPIKICDYCGTYNHTRVKFCTCCGMEFIFEQKIVRTADTQQLISGTLPQVETFNVDRVMYGRHIGRKSGNVNIKVSYLCGLQLFNEFVSFDTNGYAKHKANEWWRQRHSVEPPLSTDMALMRLSELRTPKRVRVWINRKYPEVLSVEW